MPDPIDHNPPIRVAILAGGESSRMGRDKALVQLESTGLTLLETVLATARQLCPDPFIVSRPRPEYDQFGASVLPDLYGSSGVLGGIGSAVAHAAGAPCLVVSCDMPFLNLPLLCSMAAQSGKADVVIPVVAGESRQGGKVIHQTLHAIYGPGTLPAIEQSLASGNLQVIRFFDQVSVMRIDETTIRQFDENLRTFFSVNTVDALALANAWLAAEGPHEDPG